MEYYEIGITSSPLQTLKLEKSTASSRDAGSPAFEVELPSYDVTGMPLELSPSYQEGAEQEDTGRLDLSRGVMVLEPVRDQGNLMKEQPSPPVRNTQSATVMRQMPVHLLLAQSLSVPVNDENMPPYGTRSSELDTPVRGLRQPLRVLQQKQREERPAVRYSRVNWDSPQNFGGRLRG